MTAGLPHMPRPWAAQIATAITACMTSHPADPHQPAPATGKDSQGPRETRPTRRDCRAARRRQTLKSATVHRLSRPHQDQERLTLEEPQFSEDAQFAAPVQQDALFTNARLRKRHHSDRWRLAIFNFSERCSCGHW